MVLYIIIVGFTFYFSFPPEVSEAAANPVLVLLSTEHCVLTSTCILSVSPDGGLADEQAAVVTKGHGFSSIKERNI